MARRPPSAVRLRSVAAAARVPPRAADKFGRTRSSWLTTFRRLRQALRSVWCATSVSRTGTPSARLVGSPSTSARVSRSPLDSFACCSLPWPGRTSSMTPRWPGPSGYTRTRPTTSFCSRTRPTNGAPCLGSPRLERAAVQEYEAAIGELRRLNAEVLAAAQQLKPLTIEALLAKSDLEVGIEALFRGYRWD